MRDRWIIIAASIAVIAVTSACSGGSGGSPGQGGGQGGRSSAEPAPVVSSDNAACIFTTAQMSAILGRSVSAENLSPHVPADHICGFGAVPVGRKYLYFSNVELECGTFGGGQYADWSTGSYRIPGTRSDVRTSPKRYGGYFVKLPNGCVASDLPGFNMRTGHIVPGSRAAAIAALDQYAGQHGG